MGWGKISISEQLLKDVEFVDKIFDLFSLGIKDVSSNEDMINNVRRFIVEHPLMEDGRLYDVVYHSKYGIFSFDEIETMSKINRKWKDSVI